MTELFRHTLTSREEAFVEGRLKPTGKDEELERDIARAKFSVNHWLDRLEESKSKMPDSTQGLAHNLEEFKSRINEPLNPYWHEHMKISTNYDAACGRLRNAQKRLEKHLNPKKKKRVKVEDAE